MKIFNSIKKEILWRIKRKNINAIVLFGSRARKDFTKNSDFDINIFTSRKNKSKKIWIENCNEEIFVNIVNPLEFKDYLKKGHSFLYCTFRDGIPLYQKNNWFDKTKPVILKIKPSKKITSFYLEASLKKLIMARNRKFLCHLEYEDNKTAANQLGFAILMNNGTYPKSPHTLKKELIVLNKGYRRLANEIKYAQDIYYLSKNPKKAKYKTNINFLTKFSRKYAEKNFPEIIESIKDIEKIAKIN